jgi:hypothetical protein
MKDTEEIEIFLSSLIISFMVLIITILISWGITLLFLRFGIKDTFIVFFGSNVILNLIFFSFIVAKLFYEYEKLEEKYEQEYS